MKSSLRARAVAVVLIATIGAAPGVQAATAGPKVTVYTRDLGFVRETRALDIAGARDTVRIDDVPARLDFSSARLAPAGDLKVTRLAWRYDVASGDALIEHALGRRVRVTSRGDRATEGALVSADESWLVVRADDGSLNTVSRQALETVRLANPPGDIALRPALEAVLEGGKRGRVQADLSYLTGGLSWNAEHVCVRRGESGATWSAGVTVRNETGRDFVDATLKLVAGEPRREMPAPMPVVAGRMEMMAKAADAGGEPLGEQAFADYHLYTLDRPATLRDRETQRLTMIEPRPIKLQPRYLYRGGAPGVSTQLVIVNDAASGLGVPLPAGRVRFYEADAAGDLQFTGETGITHTAEGEKLTLDVGQAFDLAAERREVRQRRISDREREYAVEIKLRNRKKGEVSIVVEEGVPGDWEMTQKTHEYTRKDANTVEFKILVPAGKEAVLAYTARVRY